MAGSQGDKYYDVFLDYSLWLKNIGNKEIMDEDCLLLLLGIKKLGSIKQAAEEIEISYRKAWNVISKAEKMLGFGLVVKHRGGKLGGYTSLSPEGENLVNAYCSLKTDINKSIKRVTREFFHKLNQHIESNSK
jgi:molybdate transport system regulatory protein